MKRIASILVVALMLGLMVAPMASTATITARTPVIFVSAGQSGGVYVTNAVADQIKLKYDWADAPTGAHLNSGVGLSAYNARTDLPVQYEKNSGVNNGTKYNTLVMVMGCTLKGMGASGLNIDTEVARCRNNIAWAKANNVKIIGMHVEGASLRGKTGSDNERIIDAVAPQCDQLIVIAASNQDKKFTDIATKNNIPFEEVTSARNLGPVLQKIFGL